MGSRRRPCGQKAGLRGRHSVAGQAAGAPRTMRVLVRPVRGRRASFPSPGPGAETGQSLRVSFSRARVLEGAVRCRGRPRSLRGHLLVVLVLPFSSLFLGLKPQASVSAGTREETQPGRTPARCGALCKIVSLPKGPFLREADRRPASSRGLDENPALSKQRSFLAKIILRVVLTIKKMV